MSHPTDLIPLTTALLQAETVTPDVKAALDVLEPVLKSLGFWVERPVFHAPNSIPVENLYARLGTAGPVLCFAGHVDVVPVGDAAAWVHPPFSATQADGKIYARGAVDMKSSITAFIAAVAELQNSGVLPKSHSDLAEGDCPPRSEGGKGGASPQSQYGSIALLITGDEEGPAVNGTKPLLEWCAARGEVFDACLVGEPTSVHRFGDGMKIGRRGSLSGTLTVFGTQGHAAYPEKNDNPVPKIAALVHGMKSEPLDAGTANFQPSNLEFVSIDVGNTAFNVIPARASAKFNIRFNELHTADSLKALLQTRAEKISNNKINFAFEFEPAMSNVFITKNHPFVDVVAGAVEAVAGVRPERSTAGGTSDARFIKDYCPVVEFGPLNATIHQVNEHIGIDELHMLKDVYKQVIERYFGV